MKSIKTVLPIVFAIITSASLAQTISKYSFSTSSGTYTSLTGGTIVPEVQSDDRSSLKIDIGFTFIYMGVPYTQVTANSNGWLSFNAAPIQNAVNNLASTTAGLHPLIAPFWDDLDGRPAISPNPRASYLTTGSAGNRVFTFEWANFAQYSAVTPLISFQAKLFEATGAIQFVYRQEVATASGLSVSSGITSASNSFLSLASFGSGATVSNSVSTNNLATTPATGQVYTFTPPQAVISSPVNLSFTGASLSGVTLNWTDASSNETNFYISRSEDGINYIPLGSVPSTSSATTGTVYSYVASGLSPAKTSYWQVNAFSEGVTSAPLSGSQTTAAGTISGIRTVGAGGHYPNLTAAFNDIKTNGLTGNLDLQLVAGYPASTETYPIVTSSASVGNYSVKIYPTVAGLSISSSHAVGTLDFNGGVNIVVDGRINGTGSTKNLVIENTTTGYAIDFINDATNNSLQYCIIKGGANTATSGVVVFGSTSGIAGNSFNTISNSDLRDGASFPTNIIYSKGNPAVPNRNNIINANNIFNFFNAAANHTGISLNEGAAGWTISDNSFYQTSVKTSTAVNSTTCISINNVAAGRFSVTGNYIGGSGTGCSGMWTNAGAFANRFVGIYVSVSNNDPSSVQGNSITNISWTSTDNTINEPGMWAGMVLEGTVNAGNITGNVIGSANGSGTIMLTANVTGARSNGIILMGSEGSLINLTNNTVASVTIAGASAAVGHSFTAISNLCNGVVDIVNNTIGSPTSSNSIHLATATTGSVLQFFKGINVSNTTGVATINNNTIAHITNASASSNSSNITSGIFGSGGVNKILNNRIHDISSAGQASTGLSAALSGIAYSSSGEGSHIISSNIIHSLIHSGATSGSVQVTGIYYAGPATGSNLLERNFIHSLNIVQPNVGSTIKGMMVAGGTANVQNNMIRLGRKSDGSSIISDKITFTGVEKTGAAATSFFHNSIYMGRDSAMYSAPGLYAFRRLTAPAAAPADSIYNNVFVVRGSSSFTMTNYLITLNSASNISTDYNLYDISGQNAVFGYIGSPGGYLTLNDWKTSNPTFDAHSLSDDPLLVNPTGDTASVNLHLQPTTFAEGNGLLIPSVIQDFDGDTRANFSPTDIGADAGDYKLILTDIGLKELVSPVASACFTSSEQVQVKLYNYSRSGIKFDSLNAVITITAASPTPYSSSITLNTGSLASRTSMIVTMPAPINMTASGNYRFTGTVTAAGDVDTSNNAMAAVLRTRIGGGYTVGVGGDYPTITQAIAAINNAPCFEGGVTLSLIDTLYASETFPILISKKFAPGKPLIIKPAPGVKVKIKANNALGTIIFAIAGNIQIDGSNAVGGTTRDLTILNTNTSGTTIGLFNDVVNVSIRNTVIEGVIANSTKAVIFMQSTDKGIDSVTIANNLIRDRSDSAGTPLMLILSTRVSNWSGTPTHSNITIVDNEMKNFSNIALYAMGYVKHLDWKISGNQIYQDVNRLDLLGIQMQNGTNVTIDRNKIHSFRGRGELTGIRVLDMRNTTLSNNEISNFSALSPAYGDITGIHVEGGYNTPSDVLLANNMISLVPNITTDQKIIGIHATGSTGGTFNAYHNTVYIGGTGNGINFTWAFLRGPYSTINCTLKNNIFFNNRISNLYNFAGGDESKGSGTFIADRNIYVGLDLQQHYMDYGVSQTGPVTAAQWQAGTPLRDSTSQFSGAGSGIYTVAGFFISQHDLHVKNTFPGANAGVTLSAVKRDFDDELRDTLHPYIGADEWMATPCILNTWTGILSNVWENPANWSCGTVPGPVTNVTIPAGAVVLVHSNATVYSLTVQPGASLTVGTGFTLTVLH
jgi:hypothetical protein